MERLQKVMAQAGIASRRQCEALIKSGQVRVNGKVIQELGVKVDPIQDQIEVRGKKISLERKRTFLFYKPLGVITSLHDPQGRRTVADYFKKIAERLYPVGRLDYDTEGLLLLTNDGELAHRLAHPRYEVAKVYVATVKGRLTPHAIGRLEKGVKLEDGWTAPAHIRVMQTEEEKSKLEITLHEGRNRQVRRMCQAIGFHVMHLLRKKIGFLTLHGLKRGEYRELTPAETEKLRKMLLK
jgi:23S rRNA pseudouridine2605 synthase